MSARARTRHVCSACGREEPRWLGQCPACDAWGTLVEEVVARAAPGTPKRASATGKVVHLADVEPETTGRIATGVPELDRVLGGGVVPGSLILLGGEPGVGKSSLTSAVLSHLGGSRRVLLVTGEESPAQVRLRAERVGPLDGVGVLAETDLDTVCATIAEHQPDLCVIDSVQTLYSADIGSAPGSVAQVREAAGRMLRLAKGQDIAVVLVGHVTKEGAVAGPRVLEHLVDVVLMFEGDAARGLRVLRAVKNRFGAADEIGLFEMTSRGLVSVADASGLHERSDLERPGACALVALEGSRPLVLDVQALVAPSDLAMPRRLASGLDRNRLSLLLAVLARHARLALGQHDVFVNVAGGVRVDEPAADLAVVLALASAARGIALGPVAVFGEVALTGRLRPVPHAERRLAEAGRLGLRAAIVPTGTARGPLAAKQVATLGEALETALGARPLVEAV